MAGRHGNASPGVKMLISVHLPKTAGTSFGASLKEKFGSRLLEDYGDLPLNTSRLRRNASALYRCIFDRGRRFAGIECVHGHFLPLKYRLLGVNKEVTFVTWMRDPVERLASHYYFWKQQPPDPSHALWVRVVREQWTFERFCFGAEMRNAYSQLFWGFPLSRFDFIGITEHFAEDFEFFARRFLGDPVALHRLNVNREGVGRIYVTHPKLRQEIASYHDKDMALYRQAMERRQRVASSLRE